MEKVLPKGWVETTLFNIASVYTGKKDANHATKDGCYPFFTCAYEALKSSDYSFDDEVLILPGNGANVGEVFFYKGKFQAYQRTYVVGNISVNPKYAFYHFKTFWKVRNANMQYGSATNYIKIGNFEEYIVSLPPLAEQERIVAKLDALFAQHEKIKSALARIPQLLKDFRKQVLTQAITEETIKLGEVLIDIKYGTSKKSDYEIHGTPILRIPNIGNGLINDNDLKFTSLDLNEFEALKLKENDILIIRSNGSVTLVGQSAIITKEFENYCYAGYLIRIRLNETYSAKFLNYIFKSNFIRHQMIDTSKSTSGINNINSREIQNLNIPNISFIEQQEIVSHIESLFAKADTIEARYQTLKAKVETLPQAILHKAFKGELVPQLPTDGDAKDLLAEIIKLKEEAKPKQIKKK